MTYWLADQIIIIDWLIDWLIGPCKGGYIHVLHLNFKAWYVAISEGSCVVVRISTRNQSLVAIS